MLKNGQTARAEITGYTSDGLGVCHIEGCAVFVPNAVRGEICEIQVTHVSRNSAHGRIRQIVQRSPHRIHRTCPEAKLCGGCQYHHMDYAEELWAKAKKVTDALNRIGGQSLGQVPITGADGIKRQYAHNYREQQRAEKALLPEPNLQSGVPAEGMRTAGPSDAAAPSGDSRLQAARSGEGNPNSGADEIRAWNDGTEEPAEPLPRAAWGYRNKAQYPLALQNGRPVAGFYRNRTHDVVPIRRCAILPEVFDRAKDVILRWAEEDRVSVYDEQTGKGLLRHIYLRRGTVTNQLMVCLVVNGDRLPREQRLVHALQREIPDLTSVLLSVNTKNTNVVLGDRFRVLWGKEFIEDQLCGFTFRLSPRSFYQVNHDQAQRLYAKAVELADLHGTERVLDLYCGTGTITLALSRAAGKAIGVEVVPQAIEDAKQNAIRNGVTNVEFFCADAGEAAGRFAALGTAQVSLREKPKPNTPKTEEKQDNTEAGIDVILVDPPRKGLAPEVIDAMVQMAPDRIVYVSCDPATLARDVQLLTRQGYTLTHAEAFDLFPRTYHVETVVRLSRQ